jgi:hypothetical protein
MTFAHTIKSRLNCFLYWIFSLPTASVLILTQGISVVFWWIAGSYFGLDIFYSRSFSGDDSWCDPLTQGMGVHCWGDYYSLTQAFTLNPESPYLGPYKTSYGPAGLLFVQFFHWVGEVSSQPRLGLTLYMILVIATIGWSVWKASFGINIEKRLVLFSALTFFAPPVIMVLDRGNTVAFLLPLMIWYFESLVRGKYRQVAVAIVVMSLIKPHFAILVLALFIFGRIIIGAKAALAAASLNLLPFVFLWGSEFYVYVNQWLLVFFGYQAYQDPENPFPTNISFSHSIIRLSSGVNDLKIIDLSSVVSGFQDNSGTFGFIVGVFVLLIVLLFRKILTQIQISILIISCVSLMSATTYLYYAVFAIPNLLFLKSTKLGVTEVSSFAIERFSKDINQNINFVLWLASVGTLVQFPIFDSVQDTWVITTSSMIGGVWISAYLVIATILIVHTLQNRNLSASKKVYLPLHQEN